MKKRALLVTLALTAVLALSACGKDDPGRNGAAAVDSKTKTENGSGSETATTLSASEIADQIKSQVTFNKEMVSQDATVATNYFSLPDTATSALYFSSDVECFDTLGVFECASEADATEVKNSIDMYVTGVKEQAQKYKPEEGDKTDHAIVKVSGKIAVICITSDYSNAETVINSIVK